MRTLQYFEILICAGEALFDIVSFLVFLHPWSTSLAMQDAEYLNKADISVLPICMGIKPEIFSIRG